MKNIDNAFTAGDLTDQARDTDVRRRPLLCAAQIHKGPDRRRCRHLGRAARHGDVQPPRHTIRAAWHSGCLGNHGQ